MNLHRLMTSAFFVTWLAASLRLAGPVLLAALGETFAERSGVLNVGIEGTILLGALASFLTDYVTGMVWLSLLAAMLTGIFFNLLLAWMYVTVRASQVVVGLVFNVLAHRHSRDCLSTGLGRVRRARRVWPCLRRCTFRG